MRFREPEAAALFFRNRLGTAQERLSVAEHGFSFRFTDPVAMCAWCDAALTALPPETEAHTAARLHAYAGNAHRIMGDFARAEEHLTQALALDPGEPRLLDFKVSLLYDLHRLEEASETLSRAAALRSKQKDPLSHALTLLQTAMVLNLSEKPDQAAAVVLSAVEMLADLAESEEGESLLRTALQNLAIYLIDAGRPAEALQVVVPCRTFVARGGARCEIKMDWVLARIAGALGDPSARILFVEVRERCAAEQMLQEVALVSLDLARHLTTASPFEAKAEVAIVGPILAQIGIPEDSQEVRLLNTILKDPRPDVELICELSRLLYVQRKFWAV